MPRHVADRLAATIDSSDTTGMTILRRTAVLLLVVVGLLALVQAVAGRPTGEILTPNQLPERFVTIDTARQLDLWFETRWQVDQIPAADDASELAVLRRLSLALHGTIPSLEELRQFQSDSGDNRLQRWTQRLLDDSRYATYFAERLGRALVGAEEGPFLAFRRDRFHAWLADQLAANQPWDRIVTALVTSRG
ncbi:MAG: DUF1549 domain-containing protein, partial [Planctomycetaceae bacterium]